MQKPCGAKDLDELEKTYLASPSLMKRALLAYVGDMGRTQAMRAL